MQHAHANSHVVTRLFGDATQTQTLIYPIISTCSLPVSLILAYSHTMQVPNPTVRRLRDSTQQRSVQEGRVSQLRLDNFLRWQPNDLCPIRGNRTLGCLRRTDPSTGPPGEVHGELMWLTICGRGSACGDLWWRTMGRNGKAFYERLHINQQDGCVFPSFSPQQLKVKTRANLCHNHHTDFYDGRFQHKHIQWVNIQVSRPATVQTRTKLKQYLYVQNYIIF